MKKKAPLLVIFLGRSKLYFYQSGNKNLESIEFSKEVVRDLQIVDKKVFYKQVKDFISQKKYIPAPTLIIFSKNVYFEKDLIVSKEHSEEKQVVQFADLVPFDDLIIRTFKIAKEKKMVALDRDSYQPLVKVLLDLDFTMESMITASAMAAVLKDGSSFTAENAAKLIKKIDSLKVYDFLASEKSRKKTVEAKEEKQKRKNRLFILLVFFLSLILILIVVLIWDKRRTAKDQERALEEAQLEASQLTAAPVKAAKVEPTTAATSGPEPTPTPKKSETALDNENIVEEELAIELDLGEFKVELINGSSSTALVNALKSRLVESGFENVSIDNGQTINASKTLIVFASDIPVEVRNLVISKVKRFDHNYTVKESSDLSQQIMVTLVD